ncbi:maleylpyruvate isomerase family mycothiol-dependent enzyme [Pedococcus sp. 5OH_020]|uniref:maleylpyruvate isomerase family mycothiol-dependent enzyme n=1 Tax=Pedococcus sp. 5OH_020 TaxID=2989814 RepID=UPI0022E9B58F|nr:maleylpyruvate isomerase family mycothiol-dependent enzyme [Pedococcus sp. 5OH_020]
MPSLTTTETDALWAGIDDQRARTAALLEALSPEQWEHPSLCDGWTVRHVAAHLTMQQQRVRDALGFIGRHPRILLSMPLNTFIHDAGVLQAQALSTQQIVAGIRNGMGSRRHNPGLTSLETLTDILVHSQDIAIPLGVDLPMRPALGALAATRRWDTRDTWLASVNHRLPWANCRLIATDTDWRRGQGPEVTGPIAAILLLITGRTAALEQLAGKGADALRLTQTRSA